MKRILILSAVVCFLIIIMSIPAVADDLEETVKYKPPTMDQTVDYIAGIMTSFVGFDSGECMLTTRMIKNRTTFEYHTPLKEMDPSPSFVSTRLSCVTMTVPRNQNVILRIGKDNKEDMKNKVDVCTQNRENAEHLATALRYLIGLCSGNACANCPPFPWERR